MVFGCAQGESGEVVVLLGAKEEEKELGWGEERGWRPVSGRRRAQARTRGFWPFKANQGRRGRRFGGRWRAALMAGRGQRLGRARPARLGATAARRRVAVLLSRRVRQRAERGEDGVCAQVGWGVSGAAPRGSRAASSRQRRSEAASARAACLNACARREGRVSEGERERKEKGSGERERRSTV